MQIKESTASAAHPTTDDIDVFYGRVTRSSAQVYVRVNSLRGGGDWSISGKVRGPNAPDTRTLPTTVKLSDMGEGETLLASCAIPDPGCWNWQLPCTYDLEIELKQNGELRESNSRSLGIRYFGASGRDLRWESKRWVFRGVSSQGIDEHQVQDLSDNVGTILTSEPAETLLERASTLGVLMAVEVASSDLEQQLRRLSRWPCVAIAILPSDISVSRTLRAAAGNMLLAQRLDPQSHQAPEDWAEVVFCNTTNVESFQKSTAALSVPVVAERPINGNYTLLEARRECDSLQRDLAPLGDYAGYVVRIGTEAK